MDEQEFSRRSDQALDDLNKRIEKAAASYSGENAFEADYNAGALVIEFEDSRAKFVVSPNSPVQQIWVSANLASHKLGWDAERNAFAVAGGGLVLADLVAAAISEHLGAKVSI